MCLLRPFSGCLPRVPGPVLGAVHRGDPEPLGPGNRPRKTILSFYHFHDSGRVEDNIDGGQITAREWSELIGFGPILCGLEVLGWLPDVLGPARENHIVRSSSIVPK